MNKVKVCCICGKEIVGYGNNPDGAAWKSPYSGNIIQPTFSENERCCDECNNTYVIPGRLYSIYKNNK
ncbi:MAG: hypothetical protein J6W64_08025 [Bacilli bacterium]|nr:hypothetical protein [Bacilli bacterium]